MKKGPYEVLSTKIPYQNPWVKIVEEEVIRPSGEKGMFSVVDMGSGVSIVAVNEKEEIVLIREYYYALEQYLLETPSGSIDPGEDPLTAAKRELLEETGYEAQNWRELGVTHPMTMILKCPAYLFLATNLEKKGEPEDGIEVIVQPFEKAYQQVIDSTIVHAPSSVAILKAKAILDSQ